MGLQEPAWWLAGKSTKAGRNVGLQEPAASQLAGQLRRDAHDWAPAPGAFGGLASPFPSPSPPQRQRTFARTRKQGRQRVRPRHADAG